MVADFTTTGVNFKEHLYVPEEDESGEPGNPESSSLDSSWSWSWTSSLSSSWNRSCTAIKIRKAKYFVILFTNIKIQKAKYFIIFESALRKGSQMKSDPPPFFPK